jgi:hypothetical protein
MSKSKPASRVRNTYDFIKAQSTKYPVQALCRVLNVAPSGYYAWLNSRCRIERRRMRAWSA